MIMMVIFMCTRKIWLGSVWCWSWIDVDLDDDGDDFDVHKKGFDWVLSTSGDGEEPHCGQRIQFAFFFFSLSLSSFNEEEEVIEFLKKRTMCHHDSGLRRSWSWIDITNPVDHWYSVSWNDFYRWYISQSISLALLWWSFHWIAQKVIKLLSPIMGIVLN